MQKFDIEKELNKHLKKSNIKGISVGFVSSAKYNNGLNVATIAYNHNYGLGVPQRAFFTQAVAKNSKKWENILALELQKGQDINIKKSLEVVANVIVGDIKKSITDLTEPPLKKSTIEAKKSTKPLIDTGLLRNSVTYRLEKR